MQNKTADRYKALKTGGETWNVYDGQRGCSVLRTLSPNASYNKSTVDEVVSLLNASLQCAEMKEENEKLRGALVIANENTKRRGETISQLQEEVERLRSALDEIAYPIKYMQMRARESGAELNGIMAVQLSESSSHLKGIALKALSGKESKTE